MPVRNETNIIDTARVGGDKPINPAVKLCTDFDENRILTYKFIGILYVCHQVISLCMPNFRVDAARGPCCEFSGWRSIASVSGYCCLENTGHTWIERSGMNKKS